jgi:hypothetical protein
VFSICQYIACEDEYRKPPLFDDTAALHIDRMNRIIAAANRTGRIE